MPPSSKAMAGAASKSDPRSYIKPQPLPVPSQKGVRIQARSATVYNPSLPNRDVIRQENYERRRHQMRNQGFRSRPDKPYQGLGDPFYLDTKKLILHSLGQWDQLDTSSSSESEDDAPVTQEDRKNKSTTPANFVLRRGRKGLNTLNKEVTRQRGLIRNVRLGHGLFQLLRREREDRTNARNKEELKKRQQQLNEWQPPRYSSSSEDETDEDISEDVDLKSYMMSTMLHTSTVADSEYHDDKKTPGSGAPLPSVGVTPVSPSAAPGDTSAAVGASVGEGINDQKGKVVFQGLEEPDESVPPLATSECGRSLYAQSARSRTSRASSRKKLPPARPYTPQHSFIGAEFSDYPDSSDDTDTDFISVKQKEIGGSKTTVIKQQNEKKNDTRWKQFVTNQVLRGVDGYLPLDSRRKVRHRNSSLNYGGRDSTANLLQPGMTGKRPSVWRLGNKMRSKGSAGGRNSVASIASLSDSQAGVEHGSTRGYRGNAVIPEGSELSHELETGTDVTEDEDLAPKGPLRYLDEYYEQSNPDNVSQQDVMSARSDRSSTASPSVSPQVRRRDRSASTAVVESHPPAGSPRKNSSPAVSKRPGVTIATTAAASASASTNEPPMGTEDRLKFLESITRSEEDPRFHALAHPREKMSSKDLRADLNVHPRLTPAVLEYQASLPSNRVGKMPQEQKQKFAEVKQERALMMHDALEAKDRQKLRVLQNKFLHMPTGGCSFHRALAAMRSKSAVDEELREKRRHSSTTHQAWYIDLLSNVPEEMKKEWYFQVILDKLSKYGLVDSTKQSAYKLLKVLAGLRDWEVCCPDVSAAVEFCRDRICEMSVDDFEDWFRSQFPTVLRPQTAPAAGRATTKDGRRPPLDGEAATARGAEGNKVPRSAPPDLARSHAV